MTTKLEIENKNKTRKVNSKMKKVENKKNNKTKTNKSESVKMGKKKVTLKTKVKEPSTKYKVRELMEGNDSYPENKVEQKRCDDLAYMFKLIIEKSKVPMRNFRINGQYYSDRHFNNHIPPTAKKTLIDELVGGLDIGGLK